MVVVLRIKNVDVRYVPLVWHLKLNWKPKNLTFKLKPNLTFKVIR